MDNTYDIQALFYQGSYTACIEAVQANATGAPSDPETQTLLLYGARSQIALKQPSKALTLLPDSIDSPAAQAVRALANYVQAQIDGDSSRKEDILVELDELLDQAIVGDANGQTIRVCVATAMARDDDPVGALEALGMGSASSKEIEW